jgi:hypothetical protein
MPLDPQRHWIYCARMKAILTTLLLTFGISCLAQTNVPNTNAAAIVRAAANDPLQSIRAGIKIREDRLVEAQRQMRDFDALIAEQTKQWTLAKTAENKSAERAAKQKLDGYRDSRRKVAAQSAQLKLEIADLRTRYKIPEPEPAKKTTAKK